MKQRERRVRDSRLVREKEVEDADDGEYDSFLYFRPVQRVQRILSRGRAQEYVRIRDNDMRRAMTELMVE